VIQKVLLPNIIKSLLPTSALHSSLDIIKSLLPTPALHSSPGTAASQKLQPKQQTLCIASAFG
jgi:hypothetical protein